MPYCLSCGQNTPEPTNGMCRQCQEDLKMAEKHGDGKQRARANGAVDLKYIEDSARRYAPAPIAIATIVAVQDLKINGSEYGWE